MDSDKTLTRKPFLVYATLLIILGVALGAIGAHGLEGLVEAGKLEPKQITSWKTGVLYQLLMSLGILILIILERLFSLKSIQPSLIVLSIGTSLFSFSIYLLVLNHLWNVDAIKYAMIPLTPIGGVLMIIAWVLFLLRVLRK